MTALKRSLVQETGQSAKPKRKASERLRGARANLLLPVDGRLKTAARTRSAPPPGSKSP
jgi:hypothetical protein